ncbi:hypothetical protein HW555_013566 [Spodoptera exigua]|uniref:MULE transposase domain-containing protein n=1 Tax=Spodoptera exigua TaxID=7107 RepID=A0A835KYI8_SPOEX|nr:hypothetical protein HW555_013566 [Spodoptera exigua]
MLVRHGHTYNFHRETKIGTVWRCTYRSCGATIKISENHDIRILHESAHTCQPNIVKTEILKARNLCKEAAANTFKPMPQVYEVAFQSAKDEDYELLNAIPKFSNITRSLYNVRNRVLNVPKTHFSRLEDNFLLFDDNSEPENRIIAFSTESAREFIPTLNTFFLDGTFASCCTPFYQLYCLHGDVNSYIISLLQNLTNWTPLTMVVDFEIAVINVLKQVFPHVKLQGCNFHFKQALARKAHALQLNDIEEKSHLAMCAALAHLKE